MPHYDSQLDAWVDDAPSSYIPPAPQPTPTTSAGTGTPHYDPFTDSWITNVAAGPDSSGFLPPSAGWDLFAQKFGLTDLYNKIRSGRASQEEINQFLGTWEANKPAPDNASAFDRFLEKAIPAGLGAIAAAATGGGGGILGGAAAGAVGGGVTGGIASGGDPNAILKGGLVGGGIGGVLGGIFGSPTPADVNAITNPGDFYSGQPGDLSNLTTSNVTPPIAETFPVSQTPTLSDVLSTGPQSFQVPEASLEGNAAGGLKVAPQPADLASAIQGASTAGGVTGLTPGTPTLGLDVPGITSSGSTGAVGAAGLGMGTYGADATLPAVAPTPVTPTGTVTPSPGGGGTGAGGGTAAATAAGAGVGATKLGDIMSGKVGADDILSNANLGDLGRILGTGAATIGSVIANNNIADKYDALARDYMALGAPSRQRYEASFQPGFDITKSDPAFQSAIDASTDALLRRGSVGGNPYGNPGVLSEINKYVTSNVALPYLSQYRNQNAATGGFGAFSTAAPGAASASIGATGAGYADIGRGLGNILNPPSSFEDIMKQFRSGLGVKGLT